MARVICLGKNKAVSDFKLADLVHDYRVLEVARQDAAQLYYDESFWNDDELSI